MHSIGLSRAWRLHSLDSAALVVVRHFNNPTGILPDQQVWIELKPLESCQLSRAELNGLELCIKDGLEGGRWLIDLQYPNNQLLVEIVPSESLLRLLSTDKALLDMSMWLSAHLQVF
jgi:hypothetical protein